MKNKMNNKGFSLVELIIVIAIMAILVGVLAPQYMKYVEKSRVSTDEQNLEMLVQAATAAMVDEDFSLASGVTSVTDKTLTVVTAAGGTVTVTNAADLGAATATGLQKIMEAAIGDDKWPEVKQNGKTTFTITVNGSYDNGFTASGAIN